MVFVRSSWRVRATPISCTVATCDVSVAVRPPALCEVRESASVRVTGVFPCAQAVVEARSMPPPSTPPRLSSFEDPVVVPSSAEVRLRLRCAAQKYADARASHTSSPVQVAVGARSELPTSPDPRRATSVDPRTLQGSRHWTGDWMRVCGRGHQSTAVSQKHGQKAIT